MNNFKLFIRDNVWQFVGTVIGLISLVVLIYISFFYESEVYRLQVVVLASTSLVEVEDSVSDKIEIQYDKQPVENLSLFQIRLENNGNQVIREEDFARPLKFIFPNQSEIVEASVIESSPYNLGPSVVYESNFATVAPLLLNPQDHATIRFLVINVSASADIQPFELDVRIANVKDIEISGLIDQIDEGSDFPIGWATILLSFVTFLSSLLTIGSARFNLTNPKKKFSEQNSQKQI